jgi:ABC-type amino acid transport system permease subunit
MAEIVRSGITAVDKGQVEAASALGMNRAKTLRRIVLPQASRVMIPPAGNETITMLKSTSLVSVVAVADLMYQVNLISAQTFQTIPLLIVASLWYCWQPPCCRWDRSSWNAGSAAATNRSSPQAAGSSSSSPHGVS